MLETSRRYTVLYDINKVGYQCIYLRVLGCDSEMVRFGEARRTDLTEVDM